MDRAAGPQIAFELCFKKKGEAWRWQPLKVVKEQHEQATGAILSTQSALATTSFRSP